MSDPINADGTAPDWEQRKWGGALIKPDVPSPMDEAFAVQVADVIPIRSGPWLTAGDWKWREFGREVQLRNKRLPHLQLDLFRAEAEALLASLAQVCAKPMPLVYRVPWLERLRMWWLRAVWNRKNARELDEHRAAIVKEFGEKSPWG